MGNVVSPSSFFSPGVLLDLFEKCRTFTRADETKASGFYPYFHAIEESEGPVVMIEGRKVIMAGSNNYLGLTTHPKVKEAAIRAVERYGTGCSGSRYLTGTLDLHVELEARLAKFFGKEDCLLYSTGYQTAQGIIPTLVQRGEYVVSDKDNHACIVAGNLMANGANAMVDNEAQTIIRYKHNDMKHLEVVISKLPAEAPKLIVSDGVFSTSGEIVDLPNMVPLWPRAGSRYDDGDVQQDFRLPGRICRGRSLCHKLLEAFCAGTDLQCEPDPLFRRIGSRRPGNSRAGTLADRQADEECAQNARGFGEDGLPRRGT